MDSLQVTKKQKKGNLDLNSIPLDKHIELKRHQLVTERNEAPQLLEKANYILKETKNMNHRWQWRLVKDMECEANELMEEYKIRKSMIREHEYEKLVVTYLHTYHKRVEIGVSQNFSKKKDTIDAYVKQADLTTQRQASLVNEYLAEMGNAPPRVATSTRDECPYCYSKLLLQTQKSLMRWDVQMN